ncbi:rhodanese-like domain-containing protein [Atopomonas sediminilitoris]|uniref:rhodanese-like domain-containing protein n=1 Tax=Atopomonas sediminilitoris TaxID=2919919 RepID=UPI001F4E3882|nr:rhodanese-like domain-containing protein [Atopomonas sediminilitoris]MCJ8167891.1 rhodanese-like domain-containing protein [Atopomonas sediminilitoris]
MPNPVCHTPALPADQAVHYYQQRLARETDCSDVAAALEGDEPGFTLLDVRSPALYQQEHARGALNLPHREINAQRMAAFAKERLLVLYCAGPHCNGVHKAALALSQLGFTVKEMLGGMTGWREEGLPTARGSEALKTHVGCGC